VFVSESRLFDVMQQGRPGSGGSLGQGIYGYRRPTSNTSTSSAGSGKGEEVTKSSTIGNRLAKHAIDANGNRSSDNGQGITFIRCFTICIIVTMSTVMVNLRLTNI
jgi:hypothetical protein